MISAPELNPEELQYFCEIIESLAGIYLKPAKLDLVKARLRSRLADKGLDSYAEYRRYLESLPEGHPEWEVFINSLTTNKTDFFREPKHFDFLVNTILPDWLIKSEGTFNVWSAASSTGEEAYTLAMVLSRHLPKDRTFRIIGTDIDTEVIRTAQNAVYPVSKKMEIPSDYQDHSIDLGHGSAQGWFRIKSHLKEKVIFERHNLIERASLGTDIFDLILCRNVLIYFDPESIEFVSRKLFHAVKPGGYFFIGHAESLKGIPNEWKYSEPSIFRKAIQR